jgi:tetratricopeptide (TPR) repeat protein
MNAQFGFDLRRILQSKFRAVATVGLLLGAQAAGAYDFIPTEGEFFGWPNYCQARYVTVDISQQTNFPGQVTQAQIERAKRDIGEDVFTFVHHHCAGLIWTRRARYEPNEHTRKFYYRTALGETNFTITRIPVTASLVPSMLLNLANAAAGMGDVAAAQDYLQKSIEAHPHDSQSYVAMALFHRKANRLKDAREILMKGDEATQGVSAELSYNLGLVLLDMKENELALSYARKAYDLGYPLPGLRNRLVKLGLWTSADIAKQ